MKIQHLDAHDRLIHFKKSQENTLIEGIEECRLRNPNCLDMQKHFPWVYIFGHARTSDDGSAKRIVWQPRLLKPKAVLNSYLFRLISNTDLLEIIWLLPPRELWDQYEKGKMLENENIMVSIYNFLHKKKELEMPHEEDWEEPRIKKKLEEIAGISRES